MGSIALAVGIWIMKNAAGLAGYIRRRSLLSDGTLTVRPSRSECSSIWHESRLVRRAPAAKIEHVFLLLACRWQAVEPFGGDDHMARWSTPSAPRQVPSSGRPAACPARSRFVARIGRDCDRIAVRIVEGDGDAHRPCSLAAALIVAAADSISSAVV